jgi:hypothetical protein
VSAQPKWGDLDRRYIFLLMGLAVLIPLIVRPLFPEHATPIVQDVFDMMESLPAGSRVLMPFDYGPSTAPEVDPMARAMVRHAFVKNHKIYIMALWPEGQAQALQVIEEVIEAEFPDKQEGVDWVHLGFKAGGQGLINLMLLDLRKMYTTDAAGRAIGEIPAMEGVYNLKDFAFIANFSAGFPGSKEWVQFAGDPGEIPVASGTTAVQAPLLYPYYPGQMVGLLGGLKGAAEYEAALSKQYPELAARSRKATMLMGPQAVAHLVIMLLVIVGNISYAVSRGREARELGR